MHIASLEVHTTLNTYNLWKLTLRGHLNTDARTRDRTQNILITRTDAVTARPQLHISSSAHILYANIQVSTVFNSTK